MNENPVVKSEPRKLPTLSEITGQEVEIFKKDELNLLLNQEVPTHWTKKHPFVKEHYYIPINRVETLLTAIFQEWKVEVIAYSQLFNSVSCHVRLHYLHPVTKDWTFHDGLGAVGVQTDKGEAASNLNAIKSDAVMKALPAAKSFAIKDAAEHLGKLFGRDLNRKDEIEFKPQHLTKWTQPEQE